MKSWTGRQRIGPFSVSYLRGVLGKLRFQTNNSKAYNKKKTTYLQENGHAEETHNGAVAWSYQM